MTWRRRAGGGLVLPGLLSAVLLLVAACASAPDPPPAAELVRPEWRVGDRWLFRRTPALGPTTLATHEVTEVTPEGYTMRITRLNREITRYWTRELHVSRQTAGGRPLNRFEPAAMYFLWPLVPGRAWQQEFEYVDGRNDGRYTNAWRVAPQAETVDVVAGWFVALKIERLGAAGERLDTYWYVPAVRYWVRLEDHVERYAEDLVEFRPGPS